MVESLNTLCSNLEKNSGAGWGTDKRAAQYQGGLGCFGYGCCSGMDYSTMAAIADYQQVIANIAPVLYQTPGATPNADNPNAPSLKSYAACFENIKYKNIQELQKLEAKLQAAIAAKGEKSKEALDAQAKLEAAEMKLFSGKVSIMPSKMFGKGFYANLEESEFKQIQEASRSVTTRRQNLEKQVKEFIELKNNPNLTSAEKAKLELMSRELKAEQQSLAKEIDSLNKFISDGIKAKNADYKGFKDTIPTLDAQAFIESYTDSKTKKFDARKAAINLASDNPSIDAEDLNNSGKLTDEDKLELTKELLKASLRGQDGKFPEGLESAIADLKKLEDVKAAIDAIKAGKAEVLIGTKKFNVPQAAADSKAIDVAQALTQKPEAPKTPATPTAAAPTPAAAGTPAASAGASTGASVTPPAAGTPAPAGTPPGASTGASVTPPAAGTPAPAGTPPAPTPAEAETRAAGIVRGLTVNTTIEKLTEALNELTKLPESAKNSESVKLAIAKVQKMQELANSKDDSIDKVGIFKQIQTADGIAIPDPMPAGKKSTNYLCGIIF